MGLRINLVLLIGLFLSTSVAAADQSADSSRNWEYIFETDLTLSQSYYSDNWAGGEVGNIAWTWNMLAMAAKQLNPSLHNRNTLKLRYGQTHNQDEESLNWKRPLKSDDLIDFETILRLTVFEPFDPYFSFRFESQFYDASDRSNKRYINPMTFTESAGIARVLIEEEDRGWLVRFGAASRQFVNRDQMVEGSPEKETLTGYDAGLMFDTDMRMPLAGGRVVYTGKLNLFQALYYSEKDDLEGLPEEDYWKSPDMKWENTFSANITGHIVVNLYLELQYDKEIALGGRFKQNLSLGINYKLGNAAS
jgi:hypothetical protein